MEYAIWMKLIETEISEINPYEFGDTRWTDDIAGRILEKTGLPDLYEACGALLDEVESLPAIDLNVNRTRKIIMAKNALAKAEGLTNRQ